MSSWVAGLFTDRVLHCPRSTGVWERAGERPPGEGVPRDPGTPGRGTGHGLPMGSCV